jgi:hypothetical protein
MRFLCIIFACAAFFAGGWLWAGKKAPEPALEIVEASEKPATQSSSGEPAEEVPLSNEKLAFKDPWKAMAMLDSMDADSVAVLEPVIVAALAKRDLAAAITWLSERYPDGQGNADQLAMAFRSLIPALSKMSVADVLATFERFYPESELMISRRAYEDGSVTYGLSTSDGNPSYEFVRQMVGREKELSNDLLSLKQSPARDMLLGDALAQWAKSDPASAGDLLLKISATDPESIGRLSARMAAPLGASDPARGFEIASKVDGDVRDAFLDKLTSNAVTENPKPAAEVVASLAANADAFAPIATEAFAKAWAKDDLLSAFEWLTALPAGAAREAGIGALVVQLSPIEPDSGFIWAQSIADPDARLKAMSTVAGEWNAQNPIAAAAAIEASGLTESEKQALLSAEATAKPAVPYF